MRGVSIVVGLAIIFVVLGWFLYNNRESERVITTLVSITLATATLVSLILFDKPPSIERVFPAVYFYRVDTMDIVAFTDRLQSHGAYMFDEALKTRPDLLKSGGDPPIVLYGLLLQKALFNWIAQRYFGTWSIDLVNLDLPAATIEMFGPSGNEGSGGSDGKKLTPTDIEQSFAGSPFARLGTLPGFGIVLPPGGRLNVVPVGDTRPGEIAISHRFGRLTIKIALAYAERGASTDYASVYHLDTTMAKQTGSIAFRVDVQASFKSVLGGHPDMRKTQRWAAQIANGLHAAFDEKGLEQRARDRFILETLGRIGHLAGPSPR